MLIDFNVLDHQLTAHIMDFVGTKQKCMVTSLAYTRWKVKDISVRYFFGTERVKIQITFCSCSSSLHNSKSFLMILFHYSYIPIVHTCIYVQHTVKQEIFACRIFSRISRGGEGRENILLLPDRI